MRENDGVYAAYILSSAFKGDGRHSLKVSVENLNNKAETLISQQKIASFPFYSGTYVAVKICLNKISNNKYKS